MKKKKVLITGCTKGIGLAITRKLLVSGEYAIYGIGRNTKDIGKDIGRPESLTSLHLYDCDLEIPSDFEQVLQKILGDASGIDIVINNAGIGRFKPVEQLTLADWNAVLNVNLTAAYLAAHHTLPYMKRQNFGKIIAISSDADHFSFADAAAYCASKAGLNSLIDCIRKEVAGYNITMTTISPGRVDTNFNHKKPGDRPNSLRAEDIADQVAFLLTLPERCEVEKISLNSILEKDLH